MGRTYERDEAATAPARAAVAARAVASPYQPVLDLQRLAGNAAVVQRYAQRRPAGIGRVRVSQNEKYVLDGWLGADPSSVWVRAGEPAPVYCAATASGRDMFGARYTEYRPNALFLADCLHTAEEVMHEQTLRLGQIASAVGTRQFGASPAGNREAAEKYARDRATGAEAHGEEQPAAGQAFAIVETEWTGHGPSRHPVNTSGFPYHAAAVVGVDAQDQVTLEQSAGVTHAEPGKGHAGIFDIYTAGSTPEGKPLPASFHGRHAASFSKGAITVTLVPRDKGTLATDDVRRA